MHEPRTCHVPTITTLFCIGVDRLGVGIHVSDRPGLGD